MEIFGSKRAEVAGYWRRFPAGDSYKMGRGGPIPRVKHQGYEAGYSTLYSADAKYDRVISELSVILHGIQLNYVTE
jgi:hypothetical protein